MSQSIYEKYAEKKQQRLLNATVTLSEAICNLKEVKQLYSSEYYEAACETIAILFGLSFDELDKAVLGYQYWVT